MSFQREPQHGLLILPTYKPPIFRNSLRFSDHQSSIKDNEGTNMLYYNGAMPREAQQIPLEEVPPRQRLTKNGSRWHEIWIFTTCYRTGFGRIGPWRIPCCLQFGELSLWTFHGLNFKPKLKRRVESICSMFFQSGWNFHPRFRGWFEDSTWCWCLAFGEARVGTPEKRGVSGGQRFGTQLWAYDQRACLKWCRPSWNKDDNLVWIAV